MKQNIKNQLLILLLLFVMMFTILLATLIVAVVDIHIVVKIAVVVASIVLTFYIFVLIKKINKKLVYIEKENTVEVETLTPTEQKIRCPKCYNYYDGEYCFVCGYKKENKA